ncbi:hypothetical protein OC842_002297 [Tilletia horrida]|uniref:Zn(2)-C6 fungal-type domain-containing protein n=1 Tax=Tilletia horrida TaxID=155126 RepID=A0AAN6JMG8_9BASI|nr:hypothetical protein OC842_002297 [Tilletia horrida]
MADTSSNSINVGISTSGAPPEKKRRILQACIACSAKRVKCDGQRPCSTCTRNGEQCAYAIPKKRGPPKGSTRAPRKSDAASASAKASASKAPASKSGLGSGSGSSAVPTLYPVDPAAAAAAAAGFPPVPMPMSMSMAMSMPPQPLAAGAHLGPESAHLHHHPYPEPHVVQEVAGPSAAHSRHNSGFLPTMPPISVGHYEPHSFIARSGGGGGGGGAPNVSSMQAGLQAPPPAPGASHSNPMYAQPDPRGRTGDYSHMQQYMPPPPPQAPMPPAVGPTSVPAINTNMNINTNVGGAPSASYPGTAGNLRSAAPDSSNSNWSAHAFLSQRSPYPSSTEASSHDNLPIPRHPHAGLAQNLPMSTGAASIGPALAGAVITTPSVPGGAISATASGITGGAAAATAQGSGAGNSTNHAPLSLSAHARNNLSSPNKSNGTTPSGRTATDTTRTTGGGGGGAGGVGNASNGSGSGSGMDLDPGVEPPSRFFRGGTSGLYGLATRLRDRDRRGSHPHEGAGGVVLRTYSSSRNEADDLDEDEENHVGAVAGGASGDGSLVDEREGMRDRIESGESIVNAAGDGGRRASMSHLHPYQQQQQHQHSSRSSHHDYHASPHTHSDGYGRSQSHAQAQGLGQGQTPPSSRSQYPPSSHPVDASPLHSPRLRPGAVGRSGASASASGEMPPYVTLFTRRSGAGGRGRQANSSSSVGAGSGAGGDGAGMNDRRRGASPKPMPPPPPHHQTHGPNGFADAPMNRLRGDGDAGPDGHQHYEQQHPQQQQQPSRHYASHPAPPQPQPHAQLPSGQNQQAQPGLAIKVGLPVDDPALVSANLIEDDPRMHEMMWKAANNVGPQGAAAGGDAGVPVHASAIVGPSEAPNRPVFLALNEASEPYLNEPVATNPEDLDDLEAAVGDLSAPDFTSPLVPIEVEQKLLHLWIANIGTHWTPVAPPTQEDIDAQPFQPLSDSEKHQNEAKIQQVLAAWRAIIQPERRPLLWNAILSMAADAWGGDLTEAGYPTRTAQAPPSGSGVAAGAGASAGVTANPSSASSSTAVDLVLKSPTEEEQDQARVDMELRGEANAGASGAAGHSANAGDAPLATGANGTDAVAQRRVGSRGGSVGECSAAGWRGHRRHSSSTHLIGKVRTGRQLSTALFIRAKYFLQRTNQEASLEAIQASVFLALRESGAGRASQAAHYSTNACRMALDLGLHRHKAVKRAMGPAFTRHEDESRRRTLWCAYMLDKVIAFILGRPAVLRYAEIDCPFPSEDLPDEEMPWVLMAERFVSPAVRDRMKGVPSMVASTATFGSQLACIGEKIIEQYNIVKPTDWQSWVKNIHTQLKEWHASLKPPMLDRNKHLPHSMNQLMWYNTLRILLHRPHILKEVTEPDMPSSHAECTDAVTQVCQLLSTYESFYNVRKVSTSLAFILFTSVTIALSNTTSADDGVVAEAKQRLRELMRWFKKASENYRAARHHLSIINVLAEGIEMGTGSGPPPRGAEVSPDPHFAGVNNASVGNGAAAVDGGAGGMVNGGGGAHLANPAGPTSAVSAAPLLAHQPQDANFFAPGVGAGAIGTADAQHVTTGNFSGFAHSGVGYAYPAQTLAAAQAAWRGNVASSGGGGGGVVADVGDVWGAGGGMKGAGAEVAPVSNPLDFLDPQAYLNLQSEAYWGAMPVSSENLLLWNSFHNEYLSALAACTMDQSAAAAAAAAAAASAIDGVGVGVGVGVGSGLPGPSSSSNGNSNGNGAHGGANGQHAGLAPSAIYSVFQQQQQQQQQQAAGR